MSTDRDEMMGAVKHSIEEWEITLIALRNEVVARLTDGNNSPIRSADFEGHLDDVEAAVRAMREARLYLLRARERLKALELEEEEA